MAPLISRGQQQRQQQRQQQQQQQQLRFTIIWKHLWCKSAYSSWSILMFLAVLNASSLRCHHRNTASSSCLVVGCDALLPIAWTSERVPGMIRSPTRVFLPVDGRWKERPTFGTTTAFKRRLVVGHCCSKLNDGTDDDMSSHEIAPIDEKQDETDDYDDDDNALARACQAFAQSIQDCSVHDIQRRLVEQGLAYQQQHQQRQHHHQHEQHRAGHDSTTYHTGVTEASRVDPHSSRNRSLVVLASPFQRVPACLAHVQIRTILQQVPATTRTTTRTTTTSRLLESNTTSSCWEAHNFIIARIEGTSDAHLSRGLLAVVASVLQGRSAHKVWANQADPRDLTDRLGLRRALSPGRNDGVASMVRTVQHQIQQCLGRALAPNEATSETRTDTSSSTNDSNNKNSFSSVLSTLPPKENQCRSRPKLALLLSGGVDSSVALNLLQRQDKYDITAFYLKIWLEDELAHLGNCPWEDDVLSCQAVCQQAGVPLETVSLQQEYLDRVISYTIREAQQGRTPNPDIMCNARIKFGCFYDSIVETRGFDYVATGHYAQVVTVNNDDDYGVNNHHLVRLLRAPDPVKDQSYFLCALTQDQLKRVIFPIGHLQKTEVRQLAQDFHLPNRNRPDSQGLCFLGKIKFADFLAAYLGERTGRIVDAATGETIGEHRGLWYHTVGQRKGIGPVLFPKATARGPWYVVAKDPQNDIVFCSNEYDESIFTAARSQFTVENIHWIAGEPPKHLIDETNRGLIRLSMKIRHGPKIVEGTLQLLCDAHVAVDRNGEGSTCSRGNVCLDHKDGGLAPGQFVAFYSGEECLGGGVISERHWANFLLEHFNRSALDSLSISGHKANMTIATVPQQ